MDVVKLTCEDNNYLPVLADTNYYPTVSVVTPTYNRGHIFDIAVFNWNNFSYPTNKIEWIILDDSPEESRALMRKKLPMDSRVKYYTTKRIDCIGRKRNKVNSLAKGDIIVHMDDDDYYPPDSIINRVSSLLTYDKQCVGSHQVSCINVLDDTSFKTSGGPKDNTVVTAEASLAYYRSFWEMGKFDENCTHEECKLFLRDRVKEYIDLDGAFTMIAITHSTNMSDRVIKDTINQHNFYDFLPVAAVNTIRTLQINVFESFPTVKDSRRFIESCRTLSSSVIRKKWKKLSADVKKTPIMVAFMEQHTPQENIDVTVVNVLYYPGQKYRNIQSFDRKTLNYKITQLMEFLKDIYSDRKVRLFANTNDEYTNDNITVFPWYYYNKNLASDHLIIVGDYTLIEPLKGVCYNKLIYVNIDNYDISLTKFDVIYDYGISQQGLPIKYYYLGVGMEINNNWLFIEEPQTVSCFSKFEQIHAINNGHYTNDVIVDGNLKCEYYLMKHFSLSNIIYVLSLGCKIVHDNNDELKAFGLLSISDDLPVSYLQDVNDKVMHHLEALEKT
jgi:glycosyltransferase involved in cell wall biosynthesis